MADFYTPALLPRAVFDQVIERVDAAVGEHRVALVLNEDFPFRALDPIDRESIDFSGIVLDNPYDVVDNLDHLLYFAFEEVPRETVSSWIGEKDPDAVEEVYDRVVFIRKNMPELADIWADKSSSVIPPLVGAQYETVLSQAGARECVLLYLSAARVGALGAPDKSDVARLRVQLWPSDIRLMMRELQHLLDRHLDGGDEEADGNANAN